MSLKFHQMTRWTPKENIWSSTGTVSTSSLESIYFRPMDVIYSSPNNALVAQSSVSSMSRCSNTELRALSLPIETNLQNNSEFERPISAQTEATVFDLSMETKISMGSFRDSIKGSVGDYMKESDLENNKTMYLPSRVEGAPPLKISLNHVRSLPPREQAKLPRSAILAARLDAIPNVNYSQKYDFRPLKSLEWTSPSKIASSFTLDHNLNNSYDAPSYLWNAVRPISELRNFAKPWWMRFNPISRIKSRDFRGNRNNYSLSKFGEETSGSEITSVESLPDKLLLRQNSARLSSSSLFAPSTMSLDRQFSSVCI